MTIAGLIHNIIGVLNQIIQLLMIVATVVFLWGIIQYVIAGDSEDKLQKAKDYIIYGILGLFVMVAMWGIVFAIQNTVFGNIGSVQNLYNDSESCVQAGHLWSNNTGTCN